MSKDRSFAVEDTLGRSWICYPVKRETVEKLDLLADLPEIGEADKKSGPDVETDIRIVLGILSPSACTATFRPRFLECLARRMRTPGIWKRTGLTPIVVNPFCPMKQPS